MIAAFARTVALIALCWGGSALAAEAPAAKPADAKGYREFVVGSPKAKVTIIEYASLSCPHCAHFQTETYPRIKKDYVDTGKVRFLYRDFPLDTRALAGAVIVRCVPADKGHKLMEVLFANQQEWAAAQNPLEPLRALAKSVGLAEADVDKCLDKKDLVSSIMEDRERAVKEFNIEATPAFYIGDVNLQGDQSYEKFKEVIDTQLAAPAKKK
jgi:protein-disulfide isomerase